MSEKLKTRSALYFRQMNDDIKVQLEKKSNETGIAKWVIAEKILESGLGIDKSGVPVHKWLGINANTARTGTAQAVKKKGLKR